MSQGSGLGHKGLVLDLESRDGSNCHPYQFLEICIPLCNDPIRLIQKGHLNYDISQSPMGKSFRVSTVWAGEAVME